MLFDIVNDLFSRSAIMGSEISTLKRVSAPHVERSQGVSASWEVGMYVVWSDQNRQWVAVVGIWPQGRPKLAIGIGETPDQATLDMFKDMNAKMKEGLTI